MDGNWKEIRPEYLEENFITTMGSDWMLVTAGTKEGYNTMTAAWGGVGFLWQRPVCFSFVRFSRYTFEFMERNWFHTLSFFPPDGKKALQYCGTHSGRNVDKAKETGLTPITTGNGAVTFAEARMVIECKKIASTDITGDTFLDNTIFDNYPVNDAGHRDFHRMYIGQIEKVFLSE